MQPLINTIKYHNITPIVVVFLLLGSGAAFAFEDVRHAVVGEKIEEVSGVDNAALLALDVAALIQEMRITGLEETDTAHEITYAFSTFDVRDRDWGAVTKEGALIVAKDALGDRDLGLFVQEELGEIMDAHTAYLAKAKERARETGRTVPAQTTSYTKLLGLVLNAETKKLDGYEPVVKTLDRATIMSDEAGDALQQETDSAPPPISGETNSDTAAGESAEGETDDMEADTEDGASTDDTGAADESSSSGDGETADDSGEPEPEPESEQQPEQPEPTDNTDDGSDNTEEEPAPEEGNVQQATNATSTQDGV